MELGSHILAPVRMWLGRTAKRFLCRLPFRAFTSCFVSIFSICPEDVFKPSHSTMQNVSTSSCRSLLSKTRQTASDCVLLVSLFLFIYIYIFIYCIYICFSSFLFVSLFLFLCFCSLTAARKWSSGSPCPAGECFVGYSWEANTNRLGVFRCKEAVMSK